jgi:hypothetical protein
MHKVMLLGALALVLVARCQPPHGLSPADAAPAVTAETLIGTWSGRWTVPANGKAGSVELVLARVPGRDGVLGQFTFITGALSRTLRYEGRIEDGAVRFPLVDDGRIVLEPRAPGPPGRAAALDGEWVDSRGALPGAAGRLALDRVR